MNNNSFLSRILQGTATYWVVLRREGYAHQQKQESIWFFAVPDNVCLGSNYESILLKDIENLRDKHILQNIPLSDPYPPFQYGISLHDAIDGFPIESGSIKEFIAKALVVGTNNLEDYRKLIDPK